MTLRIVHYISFILLTFFIDCRQKKLFKNVTVTGRLVNYFSKAPLIDVSVELRGNDVHSSSSYAIGKELLTSTTTDNTGHFVLDSKQSKDHPQYYLKHRSSGGYDIYDTAFRVASTTHDIGDILSGSYTFKVNVRFLSNTNSCAFADLSFSGLNLLAGQDTTIQLTSTKSYSDYKALPAMSGFVLTTKNCQSQNVINTKTYSFRFDTVDTKTILITY